MHRVPHPRRVRRVVPVSEPEIIVAEIADHMGNNEPDQYPDEFTPFKMASLESKETRNNRRLGRNNQNDAARGVQKERYMVEAANIPCSWLVKASKRPPPKAKPPSDHTRLPHSRFFNGSNKF